MDFPSHVTAIVLAKLLSTNKSTVTRLTSRGVFRKTGRGYDVISSIAAHTAHKESLVAAKHGEGAYGKARAQLTIEKAHMARLQREKMEGSVIAADEVEARWLATNTAVKTKFIAMPSKLAAQLAEESSPARCQMILRDSVYENLEDLSRGEFVQKAGK
jgi:phage terminase Nu1 subunit (DNA packaging protein)